MIGDAMAPIPDVPDRAIMATAFEAFDVRCWDVSIGGAAPIRAKRWPQRTVKVVVPCDVGGITDAMARVTADRLSRIARKLAPKMVHVPFRGGQPAVQAMLSKSI